MSESYVKFYEKWQDNSNRIERIYREVNCLKLLENNFINKPKIEHYPFPKVLSYDDETVTLSHCGRNALRNINLISKNKNIHPVNLRNTVECIVNNLLINRIQHLDLKCANVCINNNRNISLIDFGTYTYVAPTSQFLDKCKNVNLIEYKDKLDECILLLAPMHRKSQMSPVHIPDSCEMLEEEYKSQKNTPEERIRRKRLYKQRLDDLDIRFFPWCILYMF